MNQATSTPTVQQLLEASAVTPELKAAVLDFARTERPNDRVVFSAGNPPVKVMRVVCGILEKYQTMPLESIAVSGHSGCSDFHGEAILNGTTKVRFKWDCRWKAEQMGWLDYFGEPDQIRAARTFGFQCFQDMEVVQ